MRRIAKKQCIQKKLNSYWWNVAKVLHIVKTLESSENQFILWRANFTATQIYAKKAHGVAIKKPALPQPQTLCFPLFLRQLHLFRQRANNVVLQPRVQTPSGVLCTEKHVYICKHHQSQLIECSFWSADHLGSLYGPWWQSFKKKGRRHN